MCGWKRLHAFPHTLKRWGIQAKYQNDAVKPNFLKLYASIAAENTGGLENRGQEKQNFWLTKKR